MNKSTRRNRRQPDSNIEQKKSTLLLDPTLYDMVVKRASANRRSTVAEIEQILADAVGYDLTTTTSVPQGE